MNISASVVDVTPLTPLPLSGYASRSCDFRSVDDRLESNVVVISAAEGSPVVIAAMDTLFIGRAFQLKLAGRLGLSPERLLLVASHTHSAPSLTPETPNLGRYACEYGEDVMHRLGREIESMLGRPGEDVKVCLAARKTNQNVNRRLMATVVNYRALCQLRRPWLKRGVALAENSHGIVDHRVHLVVMRGSGDAVVAIVWSFAAHPAFYPDPTAVSADFPGEVRRALRQAFGQDCVVLYLPGFAGSAIPRIPWRPARTIKDFCKQFRPFTPQTKFFTRGTYRSWCARLARHAIAGAASAITPLPVDAVTLRSSVLRGVFMESPGQPEGAIDLHLARLSFGAGFDMLLTSGEMLGEWAEVLKKSLPATVLCTGYLAGRPLYLPPQRAISAGGYEVAGFQPLFSLDGTFTNRIDDQVLAVVSDLFAAGGASAGSG